MPLKVPPRKPGASALSSKGPLWKGPEKDGVTFSMLSRFLVCRERFRLYAIEGIKTLDEFNHRIHYGNMWHECEEALAAKTSWEERLRNYTNKLLKQYELQQEQVVHWASVCKVQFPLYIDYWKKHKDVVSRTPLLQEQVFNIPYKLPSGRTVRLRGKFDAVDLISDGKLTGIYLQENKTKSDIRPDQLRRQLTFDLQTMMYLVALQNYNWTGERFSTTVAKKPFPVKGVRYNVVRRPLGGGKGTISQHKPSKSNPRGETKAEFYKRLEGVIKEDVDNYFMRWKVEVHPGEVAKFKRECLDPILESVCDWYLWVTGGDPWRPAAIDGFGTGIHWRHPFGLYNSLNEGGSHDLDELLMTGSMIGLRRVDRLFEELDPSDTQEKIDAAF